MNILNRIFSEHREIEKIFKALSATQNVDIQIRRKLFEKLYRKLSVHTEVEEKVLYEHLETALNENRNILVAKEEHQLARNLLQELGQLSYDDETWIPKLITLQECLRRHVIKEETQLFEQARRIYNRPELDSLGQEFIEKSREIFSYLEVAS